MGVAGQAAAADLHAEPIQMAFLKSAFQEGPGVHAGSGVALEVDVVAGPAVVLAPEEPVVAHLVEGGRRGERREVAADPVSGLVGVDDHGSGVPTDEGPDAAFDVLVTREPRLVFGGDGVDVRSPCRWRMADVEFAGTFQEFGQHESTATSARLVDQ